MKASPRPRALQAIASGRSPYLAPFAGRGRRALARRVRGPLRESELLNKPPHPDPLPARGEREKRCRAGLQRGVGFAARARWTLALLACALIECANPALALDTVRLGKAVPNSFAFGAAEVGIEAKIFASEGIELTVSSFRGDAQM